MLHFLFDLAFREPVRSFYSIRCPLLYITQSEMFSLVVYQCAVGPLIEHNTFNEVLLASKLLGVLEIQSSEEMPHICTLQTPAPSSTFSIETPSSTIPRPSNWLGRGAPNTLVEA